MFFIDILGNDVFRLHTYYYSNLKVVFVFIFFLFNFKTVYLTIAKLSLKKVFTRSNLSALAIGIASIVIFWMTSLCFSKNVIIKPITLSLVKQEGLFPITPLIEDLFFFGILFNTVIEYFEFHHVNRFNAFLFTFLTIFYWFLQEHSAQSDFFNTHLSTIVRFSNFPTPLLILFGVQSYVYMKTKFLPFITIIHYLFNGIVWYYFTLHHLI